MSTVYLDHAATTPLRPGVLESMVPFLTNRHGNPSAQYAEGRKARAAVDSARDLLAELLNCRPQEVIFTSGGTEADNLALKGYLDRQRSKGRHLLISAIEHPAVRNAAGWLATRGWDVETVPVDRYGLVHRHAVEERLRSETAMVAVMHASNEVGTLQPIADIAALCAERAIAVLTDAVQTAGRTRLDCQELGADFVSLSAHKFGGPKGVGALVVRNGQALEGLVHGGGQERGYRSGTENVAGIVGMATALQAARRAYGEEMSLLERLSERLIRGLSQIPGVVLVGHPSQRLPGFVSVCIEGVSGDSLVLSLDRHGIAASSGPACSAGAIQVSATLLAMGISPEIAQGALRLTLGHSSQAADVDSLLEVLPPLLERLRGGKARLRGSES